MTYGSDPNTFFAPITSATGELELKGFWEHGKPDKDGVWTANAEKCPTIVKWVESIGARFGRVQLLRMQKNTMRECRWGLHLDLNNKLNPESEGWVVRVWHELTDDPSSSLVVRQEQFDKDSEVRIPLPKSQQAVVDSEFLWHGGQHSGDHMRYAVIVSAESGPALEQWIASQRSGNGQPAQRSSHELGVEHPEESLGIAHRCLGRMHARSGDAPGRELRGRPCSRLRRRAGAPAARDRALRSRRPLRRSGRRPTRPTGRMAPAARRRARAASRRARGRG